MNYNIPIIADFDGDGKDDILQPVYNKNAGNMTIHTFLTRTINESQYTYQKITTFKDWLPSSFAYSCGDMNTDGKADLVYTSQSFYSIYAKGEASLVKQITDGFGIQAQLDYTFFSHDKKFIRNKIGYPVVKELRQPNGLGGLKNITEYSYTTPNFSYTKRAFLGFDYFYMINNGISTRYEFSQNQDYQVSYLERMTQFIDYIISQKDIYQQIINTQFLSFDNKRFMMYNHIVVDYDIMNNIYTYKTTTPHTTGQYKGRVKETRLEKKSSAGENAPYEIKQTQEVSYTQRSVSANGKMITLTSPTRVTSKEEISGSSLVKTGYTDYTYYSGSPNIQRIKQWNDHGFQQQDFFNYSYGLPTRIDKTASDVSYSMRTDYTYDSKRRFITQEKSQNTDIVSYTYNQKTGNVLSVTDINNLTTTYSYDALGKKTKTIFPDGTKEIIDYVWADNQALSDGMENAVFHTHTSTTTGNLKTVCYDRLCREILAFSINGFKETQYNFNGQVKRSSYPYNHMSVTADEKAWVNYAYDTYGYLRSEKGPTTNLCYSYGEKSITVYDAIRNTTYTKTHDAAGRLLTSTDPAGTISYSYSLESHNGKICDKMQITAFNNTTSILTDQWGNRLSLSDPNAGTITSTFNGFGQLLTQTDANGTLSTYSYDNFGRNTGIAMTASNIPTTTISYTYDANGKKGTLASETISPDNTSISYTYDNFLRLTGKTYMVDNSSYTYSYSYTDRGQIENIVYPSGISIKHEYISGRLKRIRHTTNGLQESAFNALSYHLGSPSLVWSYNIGTEYTYNNKSQLLRKESGLLSGSGSQRQRLRQDFYYSYDNAGRISSRSNAYYPYEYAPSEELFFHDKINRLWKVQKRDYEDENTPNNSTLFTMDYNQNKIMSHSGVGDYSYTSAKPHALTNVELYDEETISLNRCDLTYNAFNKVQTIDEGNYHYEIGYYPNKNQAISILKENDEIISKKHYAGKAFEYEDVSNTKYHYVYAYGQPVAVLIQQGDGDIIPYTIHTDHLGSVDIIADRNGTIIDSMSFDAWGNRRDRLHRTQKEEGVTHLIDRGFTGHQHLDVFNLINMGGRIYDPTVQQFLSPDPYVQMPDNTQNLNRYAYCLNSPLMYTDPTGEKLKWWQWGLIGLGVDALTGGAISAMAAATATAASAAITTNATSLLAFNTTTYTAILPFQHTLSAIDMTVNFFRSGEGNYKGVWNAIKIDFGIANSFLSMFDFDKSASPLEWGLQLYNNFSFGEQLQTSIGRGFAHMQNIGGFVDAVGYYKGRTTIRLQGDYIGSNLFSGISFGHYVFGYDMALTPNDDAKYNHDLFAHEFGHTYQSRNAGLLYLFKYGIPSAAGGDLSEADADWRGYMNLGIDPWGYVSKYSEKPNRIKWWESGAGSILWPFMWIWNR